MILVLGVGVLLTPTLRRPFEPQLAAAWTFLRDNLEGPMAPVLDPYRRLKTRNEIGKTITALLHDRNRGIPPPEPSEFTAFMVAEVDDEDGLDGWGRPYILTLQKDSVTVVSAGPDGAFGNEDDVAKQLRYRQWPGRKRRTSPIPR